MIVDELKKSILNYAFNGKLTFQYEEEKVKIFPQAYNSDDKKIKETINNMDLPSNWNIGKFGKYITLISGQDLTSDRYDSKQKDNSIPYLTGASNLSDGKLIINRYTDTPTSIANEGNILLTCKGTIGETLILEKKRVHIARQFMAIVPNEMNTKYILYFLKNSIIELNRNAKSIIPGIDREFVLNLDIPIPPIEEQQRIVDKIEELFAKLDEIKPIEEELNKLKTDLPLEMDKSIIDYAIHGGLSNQNISDSDVINLIPEKSQLKDNYKKFNLTINEDEYPFQIPENWKWIKLGMLFDYQNGYSYKPSETLKNGKGYPVIKSQNIMKRIVEINSQTSFVEIPTDKMLKSKVNKGDFLMCLSSQSNNPEPLGKTAIYENEDFALLNQRVLKLTPINYDLSKYLYYVINSFYFHNTVSHKGGGSAQSNLKLEHVMEMYIPLPPIEEQKRILDRLEQLLPLCDDIEKIINAKEK